MRNSGKGFVDTAPSILNIITMERISCTLVMITRDGVELLYNEKFGFLSTNPDAIRAALTEDMKSSDKNAVKMSREIFFRISMSGGISPIVD